MTAQSLADEIVELVDGRNHVSFGEIVQRMSDRYDLAGSEAIEAPSCPNLFYWVNMSGLFVDAVQLVLASERAHLEPCPVLVYLVDGLALQLPLARRAPKGGFKAPRWAPVTFVRAPSGAVKTSKRKAG